MENKFVVETKNENGWATVTFASLEEAMNYAKLQDGKISVYQVDRKLIIEY